MAKNEILPFGIGANANVLTPAKYEALAARIGGFSSGVAASEQLNTVWRQSTFIASVLAQFIANRSNKDVLDDGGTAALLTNLELAIKTYANSNLPAASITVAGIAKLSSETNSSSEALAATPKAVKTVSDAALKIANNFSEIKTAGGVAVAAALSNIGALPIIGGTTTGPINITNVIGPGITLKARSDTNILYIEAKSNGSTGSRWYVGNTVENSKR
ncbi:hypothetical protein B4907_07060 [Yersinia kristensenii]|nr:hypothetical protein B4907_07060 [Yersinia kristensenii]